MKLVEATIENFRSVASPATLAVDERVTALLGKSESGKTNILLAMRSLFDDTEYEDDDRCSWSEPSSNAEMVLWLTFQLDQEDADILDPGGGLLHPSNRIKVGRRWDGSVVLGSELGGREEERADESLVLRLAGLRKRSRGLARAVQSFVTQYGVGTEHLTPVVEWMGRLDKELLRLRATRDDEDQTLGSATTLAADAARSVRLVRAPGQPQVEDPLIGLKRRATMLRNDISELRKSGNMWGTVQVSAIDPKVLRGRLPLCELVASDEVELITDTAAVSELVSQQAANPLFGRLLSVGGLTPSDLRIREATKRDRKLDTAGEVLSRRLSELWTQERVTVDLKVEQDQFRLQLKEPEGHFGRPGQRSEGFRWFLSFYLRYLAQPPDQPGGRLLLLDEPGLHLHASAQQDLLGLFEQAPTGTQIIYATHSPYLVNRNFPHRIRAVLKGGDDHRGTWIENKPYQTTRGFAWEPVRTALGVTAGNSLFFGGNNLIVEGISDQIILAAMSQLVTAKTGQVALDLDKVAIVVAGGAPAVVSMAHFCHGCADNAVVLLDADGEGRRAKKELHKRGVFDANKIVMLGSDGVGEVAIEDLFEDELYHQAVVKAYGDLPGHAAKEQLPQYAKVVEEGSGGEGKGSSSRAGYYARYFVSKKEWGQFDKAMVGRKIAELSRGDCDDKAWESTVKAFSKLFKELNRVLDLPPTKPA